VRVQEDRSGGAEPPLSDDVNEAGHAVSGSRATPNCCAASPVRRPRGCRAGPVIAACGRAVASTSTRGASCARPCATRAM
jgi:hypothetical protein